MTMFVALYLVIGTIAALDAGYCCRHDAHRFTWWADALAFAVIAVLWLPIAIAAITTALLGREP